MKIVIISGIIILVIMTANVQLIRGTCPANHAIQHDGAGNVALAGTTCSTCFPRYWCLSESIYGNNGTNVAWWQNYSSGEWWYNGYWGDPGTNGCCGMWDVTSQSKTMMATVEANFNEGSVNHYGSYETEVCERSVSQNGFFFTRTYDWWSREFPEFNVSDYSSTGPGGITTITLSGWATPMGPAHYWAKLQDGTIGTDLTLNNLCRPGGTSPCPPPILGYQIRAVTRGCADGTCNDPTPAPPTSGIVSNWGLSVSNALITPRVPTFPINNIQIHNPATCTPANRYIYIATQLAYAEGYVSTYVSRNTGYNSGVFETPIDWCYAAPSEAGEQTPMQCQKSGASITCSFSNGGSCTAYNSIYYGYLSNVSTYQYYSQVCGLGTGGAVTFTLQDENWFWVVVSNEGANEGAREGSYGKDSTGTERPAATGLGSCGKQQVLNGGC